MLLCAFIVIGESISARLEVEQHKLVGETYVNGGVEIGLKSARTLGLLGLG